jgi:hypothetical protein
VFYVLCLTNSGNSYVYGPMSSVDKAEILWLELVMRPNVRKAFIGRED